MHEQSTPERLVLLALGVVLIVASLLKANDLVRSAQSHEASLANMWIRAAIVEAEFLFGVWLLFNDNRAVKGLLAIAVFSGFAAVTMHSLLTGAESCGCLGIIRVDPWYSMSFNLAAVGGLTLSKSLTFQSTIGSSI